MKVQSKTPTPPTACVDGRQLLVALVAFKKWRFLGTPPCRSKRDRGQGFDAVNDIFELNEEDEKEFARSGPSVVKTANIGQRRPSARRRRLGTMPGCGEWTHRRSGAASTEFLE